MLKCKKCDRLLSDRDAQQVLIEMEDVVAAELKPVDVWQKLFTQGPLCDSCLTSWIRRQRERQARQAEALRSKNTVEASAIGRPILGPSPY